MTTTEPTKKGREPRKEGEIPRSLHTITSIANVARFLRDNAEKLAPAKGKERIASMQLMLDSLHILGYRKKYETAKNLALALETDPTLQQAHSRILDFLSEQK